MARKPTLVYRIRSVSGTNDRIVVENSMLTKEEAITALSNLLSSTSNNTVLELNGVLLNLRNVEAIVIEHATRMDI